MFPPFYSPAGGLAFRANPFSALVMPPNSSSCPLGFDGALVVEIELPNISHRKWIMATAIQERFIGARTQ